MSTKVTTKKLDNSRLEITGSIESELFETYRARAITELGKSVKIDGFRQGNVPENILVKHVGDMAILETMAREAIAVEYPKLIIEHKIDAIGRPEVTITKLAAGSPLEFKILTDVMPEMKLADYKKIASKAMKAEIKVEVSDQEVDNAVLQLRRMRAQAKSDEARHQAEKDGGPEFVPTRIDEIDDKDLPEIDLDFVKNIANLDSIEDFMNKLRENITLEKTNQGREKRRMEMVDTIMDKTTMDVPELLVHYETDKMLAQLKHDLGRAEMKFEDYLKNIDKTEDDLKTSWHEDATKRAKLQLVINRIAGLENLEPDEAKLKTEVEAIMKAYPDQADEARARAYVSQMMVNQAVMEFLENQGK